MYVCMSVYVCMYVCVYIYMYGKCLAFAPNRNDDGQRIIIVIIIVIIIIMLGKIKIRLLIFPIQRRV